jgi:hypothetical protein
MTLQDIVLSMVIGVLSGLVTSGLWLFIFLWFKPKIDISEFIRMSSKDNKTYQIKVINRRRSSALNVKAELHLMISLKAEEGEFTNSEHIPLRRSELFQLSGRDQHKKGAAVFRFVIDTDLYDLKKRYPHSYLAFRLFATHPVTQFGRLFKQNYPWNRIKEGDWMAVDSIKVV